MQYRGVNELRRLYLDFFESKGHLKMKSFSLVPHNDNSLLIINSGMAPLKPYFTGQEIPPRRRVTTCQKCIRTGDIENVGKTARHGTFFEMLGNFSFGDYFKDEAIHWSWEFLTETVGLDPDRLYPSIYQDDDEAFDIWNKEIGIAPERIFRFGKEDNFWEHGAGPCGPCSEIYYDRGEKYGCGKPGCTVGCDCDRYMEVWNNVFSQFNNDGHGNYTDLIQKNIDTGMGLERLAVVVQDVDSIFDVDTLQALRNKVCEMAGVKYKEDEKQDVSIRVITDHIRSVTFMVSDGIMPSNEGRGYVLRRLLRRAARHGRLLGIKGLFLKEVVDAVVENYGGNYPVLVENKDYITKIITLEEERFNETIDGGMNILNGYIKELEEAKSTVLSGEKAFKLYDTYGFPLELTEEILEEKNMTVDHEEFKKEMEAQRERARSARGETSYMGSEETPINKIKADVETEFVGYGSTEGSGNILVLATDNAFVDELKIGDKGYIVIDKTVFYPEMGGQIGDKGIIEGRNGKAYVINTKKNFSGKIIHYVEVKEGSFSIGEEVNLFVEKQRRSFIAKNHTATHMLQAALKEIVGSHVHQSGSYVDNERLRFDFTHFQALSSEELQKVEDLVNEKIMEVANVETNLMTIEEAKQSGATALFDEKYGDKVRVVAAGEFSKELCGGTHVSNVGEIGLFKIVAETGVAAGIRRIEAVTGIQAIKFMEDKQRLLRDACAGLKCTEKDILKKISSQNAEIKEKDKEIAELKSKLTSGAEDDILNSAKDINGVKAVAYALEDVDGNALRDLADKIRSKIGSGVVVLISKMNDKVNLVAMSTKDVLSKGVHCGKIIKEVAAVVGGGGGGRPDMAQAGGKNPEKINEAVENAYEIIEKLVK